MYLSIEYQLFIKFRNHTIQSKALHIVLKEAKLAYPRERFHGHSDAKTGIFPINFIKRDRILLRLQTFPSNYEVNKFTTSYFSKTRILTSKTRCFSKHKDVLSEISKRFNKSRR